MDWYWIGIGFACVKHCETYRARGFNLEMKVQLQLQDELLLRKIKEQDGFYPMINLLNMHL